MGSVDQGGPASGDDAAKTPPEKRGGALSIAAAAAVGGFLFGYDTAVVNGTVDAVQARFHLSSLVLGAAVSTALLGSAVGAWFAGPLSDRIGRVRIMLITAIVFAVSAVGSALAVGPISLTVWRAVAGMAVGAASVIVPAYIAEIAPAEKRGRFGSLQQLAIVTGIFAALLADYALAASAGGASKDVPWGGEAWRWMFASAAVPAAVYLALALRIPESPRYLVRRRRGEQAREVLERYVGDGVRLREIERSLAGTKETIDLSDLRGATARDRRFGLLPIVWTGIILAALQQFVGINVIFYYSTTLWRAVGFTENEALVTSVITSVINIAGTFLAIALIDRVGRKPLLTVGAAGMVVTLGTLAWCFSRASGTGESLTLPPGVDVVALLAANLYVVFFAASWGPTLWVLLGEMFNNRIRVTAVAVAGSAQWIANWLVTITFPSLAYVSLPLTYGIYTAFAAFALVFVRRFVRETRGRELETM
ncbi:sugar porter family MFS transporter [Micromonospora sp. NPDC048063]|uniref:sugar porter family MFS transporter n=1 Tax=Micromonospora sp. NPDC048063 TaxID=3364256 RepID=UPI003710FBD8